VASGCMDFEKCGNQYSEAGTVRTAVTYLGSYLSSVESWTS
jgi:hypothetical protein